MANGPFTPEQIAQILEAFFDAVGTRQYVGARYVPIFGRIGEDSIEWDNTGTYEPLTIVLYQGASYTSRQFVPIGVEITNEEFWACTGNYNSQVEQYRREVLGFDARITENTTDIATNTADIAANETAIAAHTAQLATHSQKLTAIEGNVATNTTNIASNTSAIATNRNNISANTADIDNIYAKYVRSFDTVALMQQSTELESGMVCHTNGETTSGDGMGAFYIIGTTGTIACANNLYASEIAISGASTKTIETAVTNWLNNHPEATTTVQDGSITTQKIADGAVTNAKLDPYGIIYDVNNIKSALPSKIERVTRISGTTGIQWEMGAYYYAVAVGQPMLHASYKLLACAVYGYVRQGDKFIVNAQSIGSGYAIILADRDDTCLDIFHSPSGTAYYDYVEYTVPYDGVMYLNTAIATYLDGLMRYRLQQDVETIIPLSSPLSGVKWTSIGDSIVEFNSTADTNWVKYMIAGTDVVNTNIAHSGTGFYRGAPLAGQTTNNYIANIPNIPSDVEFITVNGSFNDLMTSPWPSLPVGSASDSGTDTLAGYMNAFFDALLAEYPDVPVACLMTNPWDSLKPGVERADDYVTVLGEICKKNGIPFYPDCFYGCNLKPWITANKEAYFTHPDSSVDGVHPNSAGHVFLYRMIRPFLEKCVHTTN